LRDDKFLNSKSNEIQIDELSFHPRLDELLGKILKHLYSNEKRPFNLYDEERGKDVVDFLWGLLKIEKKGGTLTDLLKSLTNAQKMKLMKMIFLDDRFQSLPKDDWNYYGEYIKEWPDKLSQLLKFSELSWDNTRNEFVYSDGTPKLITIDPINAEFIEASLPDPLYEKLRNEINRAYRSNLPDSVFILSRKLIENLVIDLLRAKFPSNPEIYYDTSRKQFLDFSLLISNLNSHASSYGVDEKKISRLIEPLNKLRETANSTAHSITEIAQVADLPTYKINDLVNTLMHLMKLNPEVKEWEKEK
jgi:hypothetical protein